MEQVTFYMEASSRQVGALGIFHLYGPEAALAAAVDTKVSSRNNVTPVDALRCNEIRYGWLAGGAGAVDEVMLARPKDGIRILMTHGGRAVRGAVRAFLEQAGMAAVDDWREAGRRAGLAGDELIQPLLASCITQTQIAAGLEALSRPEAGSGEADGEALRRLLRIRRVVLAGPPNAGKSSLLNSLAGFERAFVHEEPGATRDVVDEVVDIGGYAVLLGDMPGYGEARAGLDALAWDRAAVRLRFAEAVIFVVDASRPWDNAEDAAAAEVAAILGTMRLIPNASFEHSPSPPEGGRGGGGGIAIPLFPTLSPLRGARENIQMEGRDTICPVLVVLNKSDLSNAIEGTPWAAYFPGAPTVRLCSLPGGGAREALDGVARNLLG